MLSPIPLLQHAAPGQLRGESGRSANTNQWASRRKRAFSPVFSAAVGVVIVQFKIAELSDLLGDG